MSFLRVGMGVELSSQRAYGCPPSGLVELPVGLRLKRPRFACVKVSSGSQDGRPMKIEPSIYLWCNARRDLRPGDLFFIPRDGGHLVCLALKPTDEEDERPDECVVLGTLGVSADEKTPFVMDLTLIPGFGTLLVAVVGSASFRVTPSSGPPVVAKGLPGAVKLVEGQLVLYIRPNEHPVHIDLRDGSMARSGVASVAAFDEWQVGIRDENGSYSVIVDHQPG